MSEVRRPDRGRRLVPAAVPARYARAAAAIALLVGPIMLWYGAYSGYRLARWVLWCFRGGWNSGWATISGMPRVYQFELVARWSATVFYLAGGAVLLVIGLRELLRWMSARRARPEPAGASNATDEPSTGQRSGGTAHGV